MEAKNIIKNNFKEKLNKLENNIYKLIDLFEKDIQSDNIRNNILDISNALDYYNETLLQIDEQRLSNFYSNKDILSVLLPKLYYIK